MNYPFYQVDVFAEKKYAGNQLAIVRNAADLSDQSMQEIAMEMNFSETTFILSDRERNGGYDVRIFSLDQELPFAGHPTLGTAYIIQQELIKENVPVVKLNLKVGQIPVIFSYENEKPDILWMKQVAPWFGRTFNNEEVARALNITPDQLAENYPVQEVSTGLPFIITPLKSLEAVKACFVDSVGYLNLIDNAEAKSILVFCPETYHPENQINARMFDQYHGITEDPATGSANGCLAAYLVKQRYLNASKINLRVEQGYEIGRPSLLLIKAHEAEKEFNSINGIEENIAVSVGGKVIMIAHGELV
ncbi:MAG: PhzF family phenazine biosynthesis protein [Bacillota bacterium]